MLTPNAFRFLCSLGFVIFFSKRYEVGPVQELFCEDVWHIEFYRNVENFHLLQVEEFPDVFFMEAEVIHSSCCEVFWTIHTGIVVVVSFDWEGEVDVLWVL